MYIAINVCCKQYCKQYCKQRMLHCHASRGHSYNYYFVLDDYCSQGDTTWWAPTETLCYNVADITVHSSYDAFTTPGCSRVHPTSPLQLARCCCVLRYLGILCIDGTNGAVLEHVFENWNISVSTLDSLCLALRLDCRLRCNSTCMSHWECLKTLHILVD